MNEQNYVNLEGGNIMNQLTPENLDRIKRLQPFFREKMGEWQEEDFGQYGDCKPETLGQVYLGDMLFCPDTPQEWKDRWLRIPKPIDWQDKKRGLWGMIDWSKYHGCIMPSGELWIWKIPYYEFHTPEFTDDPFTSLLKTLCEQEGV